MTSKICELGFCFPLAFNSCQCQPYFTSQGMLKWLHSNRQFAYPFQCWMTLGILAFMLEDYREDVFKCYCFLCLFFKSFHYRVRQKKEAGIEFQLLLVLSVYFCHPQSPCIWWPCLLEPHSCDAGDELHEIWRIQRALPLGDVKTRIVNFDHSQSFLTFLWISTIRGFWTSPWSQRSVSCPLPGSFSAQVSALGMHWLFLWTEILGVINRVAGFGSPIFLAYVYSLPWFWVWSKSYRQMW